jgi:hypothetical protein
VTVVGSAITADPVASVTTVVSVDPVTTVASVDPAIMAEATTAEATTAGVAATAKPLPAQVTVAAPWVRVT